MDREIDFESSSPWGCPWHWGSTYIELEGKTIKEMAYNFFKKVEKEIKQVLEEEKQENQ